MMKNLNEVKPKGRLNWFINGEADSKRRGQSPTEAALFAIGPSQSKGERKLETSNFY